MARGTGGEYFSIRRFLQVIVFFNNTTTLFTKRNTFILTVNVLNRIKCYYNSKRNINSLSLLMKKSCYHLHRLFLYTIDDLSTKAPAVHYTDRCPTESPINYESYNFYYSNCLSSEWLTLDRSVWSAVSRRRNCSLAAVLVATCLAARLSVC